MSSDLSETRGGGLGGDILEEVGGGRIAGDAAEDDASEEGGAAETVGSVHTGDEEGLARPMREGKDKAHPPTISPEAKSPGIGLRAVSRTWA